MNLSICSVWKDSGQIQWSPGGGGGGGVGGGASGGVAGGVSEGLEPIMATSWSAWSQWSNCSSRPCVKGETKV